MLQQPASDAQLMAQDSSISSLLLPNQHETIRKKWQAMGGLCMEQHEGHNTRGIRTYRAPFTFSSCRD